MLWQHCWKGLMAARPVAKRTPKPIKVKSKPKPQKQQPPPEQPPPPPPPPELQPYNEPRLFGFWKETFPDRDQRQMPQRDVVPMNVAQDSKIHQKNKVEEQQEKQQWREERGQQVTKYQQEMQSYSQKYGGQAANANAYWFSGTTGQAIRGGTGEEIAPNRQWDTKPAGGEYTSTLQASAPAGQPPADTSRAAPAPKPRAPGPSTAAAASDPTVQAWYNESSVPTQSGNNAAGSYGSGRMW
ncbi:hypothetical protein V1264_009030 [Littorina saxatilis]|uniref:Uncharacterized protein n=1 Tax=Littorina saxatilis TaxID=31220 RepID=A0AAN9AQJ5_9CAEN